MKIDKLPWIEPDFYEHPTLYAVMCQYRFARHLDWVDKDIVDEQRRYLQSRLPDVLSATSHAVPNVRLAAYFVLLGWYREERLDLVEQALSDTDAFTRGEIAGAIRTFRHPVVEGRLIEIALTDPDPYARGNACLGLSELPPLVSLPVLIQIYDNDEGVTGHDRPVRCFAADAMDRVLGTERLSKRLGTVCTFPDEPGDPDEVRNDAFETLEKLRSDGEQ